MTKILNDNGESVFGSPEAKLEKIKKLLEPSLKEFAERIRRNELRPNPQKLNFIPSITNLLDANLRKTPLVRYDYAIKISADELQSFADAFFDLLIFIRQYVPEYIANKQTFSAFASISVSAFNALLTSQDGEIVSIIESLSDSFLETNMSGAMGGTVNSTATFNRMRSKDAGYSLSLKSDEQEQLANTVVILDNDVVKRRLSNIFGNKLIDKK